MVPRQLLRSGDALLLIDVQNDFCPGGALPVAEGDRVVEVLNRWLRAARECGVPVYASRDWHPLRHPSFREQGGSWPPHCLQDSPGARFHPALELPEDAVVISKGVRFDTEQDSAFNETGLASRLERDSVRRLFVGGLAQDVCVLDTVLDAREAGLAVHVIAEGTRPVDPGNGRRALEKMQKAGAVIEVEATARSQWVDAPSAALLTDFYQLTMLQAYWREGMTEEAVFSLYFRELPASRNFILACGLDDALHYLETLRFDARALEDLQHLNGSLCDDFLVWLSEFRFRGGVRAVAEGVPVFPGVPLLEVNAPIAEAQLVESFLMNAIHLQSVLATKAARVVAAAEGRPVVDFALRRMHGADAALKGARACYLAGVAATSNVLAGIVYGIPVSGTMAHSYVEAHDRELDAFRGFAELYPGTVLVVDTYDTLEGVRKVVELARELGDEFSVRGIRLDSGNLAQLAREARGLLDAAGLVELEIFASGNLDEYRVAELVASDAPIDGFGVGTRMGVSRDAPELGLAYKLTAYGGRSRLKTSPGKPVLPGPKQVFRVEQEGCAVRDVVARQQEELPGRPLLEEVMRDGRRLAAGRASLEEARLRSASALAELPPRVRALEPADPPYPVEVSAALRRHHKQVLERLAP